MARSWVSRRVAVIMAAAFLPVLAVLAVSGAVTAQDGEGTFRPACDLVDASTMSDIIGADMNSTQLGGQYCVWEGGPTVYISLQEGGGIGMMRLVLPDPTDITIAGREAVSSPGDAQTPASVLVALDDGGALMAQVTAADGVPADPVGAALAIAEAAFANGSVLARPAVEESGPALGYEGEICDLITLAELATATGAEFATAQADAPDSCSYSADDFSALISVAITDGELFSYQGEGAIDLTVAGRPAVWSTAFFPVLLIDIGAGRLLQVGVLALEVEADRQQEVATAIGELAVSRLTPMAAASEEAPTSVGSLPPTGPGCDLVPVGRVAEITGLPFTTASDEGVSGIGCVYGSADQADGFLIMTRIESADPAAAVEEFASSVPMAAGASATQVAGRPSMSLVDPSATFVIIDLDGIPGEDGHVLSVVWLAPPAGTDAGAVITRLAEAAIAAL